MDYDLSGLSPRSFEKLVQAICTKVLGPGTMVFGDGPDGGREATFEGAMAYPSGSGTKAWEGYCVVQAKFLQRPQGTAADSRWLLTQLDRELRSFADQPRRRRPDYYIFATNVLLTPVLDAGGKDRCTQVFKKHQKALCLKSWSIWDFDQIGAFLDTHADVRQAYDAWITPGDVLALLAKRHVPRPDFFDVISNYLAKELTADQFTNLEQAGHAVEERIPLARVFVDLPAVPDRASEPPDEDPESEPVVEIVRMVLDTARDTLDPGSTRRARLADEERSISQEGPVPGRYVLVGGPGQGKTTVGQFICQLFRASLLYGHPQERLPPETRDALRDLRKTCTAGGIDIPRVRRFPIRVVLSEFADALSHSPTTSLLAYLTNSIARRTARDVITEDLRSWLHDYPWLLVLDGLDEVPATTNRELLLQRIQDFWIDAAQQGSDVLVVATTRPQGYSEEFSPDYYHHLWLAPLSPERALAYAHRFVDVRYAGDEHRKEKVLARLKQASLQESTSRLMRSPLQVTIMATLVDQIGPPPQDRWRLFHDYYEVIYRRERERKSPAADLLRDRRADIDAIHSRVALLLQLESERAGGAEARMTAARFAQIAEARLREEGHSGDRLQELHSRIIEAATNRLVFLVGLQEGQVGFEIRSLQEFMAAEALMAGNENRVRDRLRHIAPAIGWRNVFLFAAGRCFAQAQHLRDTVHAICAELNEDLAGRIGRATRAGSILALELLEDGVARSQPRYITLLASIALQLLNQPPSDLHERLAHVFESEMEELFRVPTDRLLKSGGDSALSGWALLLPLVGRGVRWAQDLADKHWPAEADDCADILLLSTLRAGDWWLDRAEEVAWRLDPRRVLRLSVGVRRRTTTRGRRRVAAFQILEGPRQPLNVRVRIGIEREPRLLGFVPLATRKRRVLPTLPTDAASAHPGWAAVIEAARFAHSPSPRTLSDSLRQLAEQYSRARLPPLIAASSPWPFASCSLACTRGDELRRIATLAEAGALGDVRDWVRAEERWAKAGVKVEDLLYEPEQGLPFDRAIGTVGAPIGAFTLLYADDASAADLPSLLGAYEMFTARSAVQTKIGSLILDLLEFSNGSEWPSMLHPNLLERMLRPRSHASLALAWPIASRALTDTAWLEPLETLGQMRFVRWSSRTSIPEMLGSLVSLFRANPTSAGILRLIGEAAECGNQAIRDLDFDFAALTQGVVRRAAIQIRIAQGRAVGDTVVELAEALRDMQADEPDVIPDFVRGLLRRDLLTDQTDALLLEVEQLLPAGAPTDRASIIQALMASLRRRASGLGDRNQWQALELPPELAS